MKKKHCLKVKCVQSKAAVLKHENDLYVYRFLCLLFIELLLKWYFMISMGDKLSSWNVLISDLFIDFLIEKWSIENEKKKNDKKMKK